MPDNQQLASLSLPPSVRASLLLLPSCSHKRQNGLQGLDSFVRWKQFGNGSLLHVLHHLLRHSHPRKTGRRVFLFPCLPFLLYVWYAHTGRTLKHRISTIYGTIAAIRDLRMVIYVPSSSCTSHCTRMTFWYVLIGKLKYPVRS